MENSSWLRLGLSVVGLSLALASCSSDDKKVTSDSDSAGAAGDDHEVSPRAGTGNGGASAHAGAASGGSAGSHNLAGGEAGAGPLPPSADGGAGGSVGSVGSVGDGSPSEAGSGGEAGATPSPGPAQLSCTDAAANPAYGAVTIRLFNNTSAPLYFGKPSVACGFYFGVDMQTADQVTLKPARDACEHSCGELQRANGCACQADCSQTVIRIEPGKSYDLGWPGTVFESVNMPSSCYQDTACSNASCLHEVSATGPVTMSADLYTGFTCSSAQCYDCTSGSVGNCNVVGSGTTSGTKHGTSAIWTSANLVTLSFD